MEDNSLVHFSILDTPIDDSPFVADKEPVHRSYTNPFSVHPAYRHVFRPQRLTFGLMAPFTGYANPEPESFTDLIADAQRAEAAGLTALWVRDVPMLDPYFGDVGQGLDPMVTLGMLAANTKNIALGSAGFISTLRYPFMSPRRPYRSMWPRKVACSLGSARGTVRLNSRSLGKTFITVANVSAIAGT